MRNHAKYAAIGIIFISGLGFAASALACSTEAWMGGNAGIPANANSGSPPTVARYSEFCGLAVTGTGHVQDNTPSDTRYRARLYVLDGLTGAGAIDIFEAYSDIGATNALFKVTFNGSQFVFDATDAGGGSATVASANGWNLVEFDWNSDGTFSYWVNADATADAANGSTSAGTGTVEAVRMGAPNGFATQTGKLTFDAFESRRSTAVGALLAGDANGNLSVNIFDIIGIQNEILNPATNLADGQPDCNGNGSVNVFDIICVQNIILGGN